MPIELVDDQGNPLDLDTADGRTLRKKLEEALSENKTLAQQVATAKATEILASMETSLVKPEDLVGVSVDQIEAKAKELQEQRQAERQETIRSVLAERGLEGSDLDAAVESLLSTGEAEEAPGEPDFTDMINVGGLRPPQKPNAPPIDDAFGNLTAHFEEQEKSSSRK